jgi:hypothetical protein
VGARARSKLTDLATVFVSSYGWGSGSGSLSSHSDSELEASETSEVEASSFNSVVDEENDFAEGDEGADWSNSDL